MSRTVAIIQARLGSTRLPGKVLLPVLGEPMLGRMLERAARCRRLDAAAVATTTEPADDAIAAFCASKKLPCVRGSSADVLDRYVKAATELQADVVVRLTGDCPLIDPVLIDALVDFHRKGGFDYSSNRLTPTFPDGLDAEAVEISSLRRAWERAKLPSEREHVTPYIYKHPEAFRLGSLTQAVDESRWRLTVDEPADLELVRRIYEALYPSDPAFGTRSILDWLAAHPDAAAGNAGIGRDEGYRRSLQEDPE